MSLPQTRAELLKQLEAFDKEDNEKWQPLVKKYGYGNVPAIVLYKCLVNEEEGKDEDQWIKNIEYCFNKMCDPEHKLELEPQYRLDLTNLLNSYETTILGIMITWQQDHAKVEKFLRGKLDLHKVIDGELYMNKWAWGADDIGPRNGVNYFTKARPVFLAVLFGKTEWLKELLGLGANTDNGLFWTGKNSNCRSLTPQELNTSLIQKHDDWLKKRLIKAKLNNVEVEKERKKIREEIRKILLVGGADQAKIKGLSNPQGLKLKY
jgi:hypothetical protein